MVPPNHPDDIYAEVRISHQMDRRLYFLPAPLITGCYVLAYLGRMLYFQHRHLPDDIAVYLYGGLLFSKGRPMYREFWDIKGPAISEMLAVVALLTGGDRETMHLTAVIITAAAVVLISALVTLVVFQKTENRLASFVAGLAPLAYPPLLTLFLNGPYVKYFVAVCGLLSLWLYLKSRYVAGGVFAALSAAYWQFGVGFTLVYLLIVGINYLQGAINKRQIGWVVVGMASTAAVIVLPFVFMRATGALFIQTVLAPLVIGHSGSSLHSLLIPFERYRFAWPVLVAGILGGGLLLNIWWQERDPVYLGLPVLGIWFGVMAPLTGQGGRPDLIPLAALISVYLGFVVDSIPSIRYKSPLRFLGTASAAQIVSAGLVFLIGLGYFSVLVFGEDTFGVGQLGTRFLSGEIPSRCHVRLSNPEQEWINRTAAELSDRQCSQNVLPRLESLFR